MIVEGEAAQVNPRFAFISAFIANVILDLVSLFVLPPLVATHFGMSGMADGWMPRQSSVMAMLGVFAIIFLALLLSSRIIRFVPAAFVNIPNKNYWLKPENKSRTCAVFSQYMDIFGTAIFAFFFVLQLLTIKANLSEPVRLDNALMIGALAILGIFIAGWMIKFFAAFRIPRSTSLYENSTCHGYPHSTR